MYKMCESFYPLKVFTINSIAIASYLFVLEIIILAYKDAITA